MTDLPLTVPATDPRHDVMTRFGGQPIVLAAAVLVALVAGIAIIAVWRNYTGTSPEPERLVAARNLQAKTAHVSEQLLEKTKGLQETQQESIDQLQLVQDQLQTVRRQLAAQQADNKRLSEQVAGLTEAVDNLRQSFAQANEPAAGARTRYRSGRKRAR